MLQLLLAVGIYKTKPYEKVFFFLSLPNEMRERSRNFDYYIYYI